MSTMLMLSGFGLVTMEDFSLGSWLVFIKIMGIVLFIYLTSPTSTHVLMKAAFEDNHMPLDEKDLKKAKGKKKVMGLELFNTMILLLLVVAAIVALRVKDLLTASVVFAVYSF